MKLWNLAETWDKVNPREVAAGSQNMIANVLEMAVQDIIELNAEVVRLGGNPSKADARSLMAPIRFRLK